MKNMSLFRSYLVAGLVFGAISVTSRSASAQAAVCEEAAAVAVIAYLEKAEPQADLEILRYPDGGISSLIDKNGIYEELIFSAVHEVPSDIAQEEYATELDLRIYEFRDRSYIVFAKLIEFAPNGMVSCKVLDVDSGQDDQD